MAKLIAALLFVAALIAVASSQYLGYGGYRGGLGYAGYRGAYGGPIGYAGLGHTGGYLGYGVPRGIAYG